MANVSPAPVGVPSRPLCGLTSANTTGRGIRKSPAGPGFPAMIPDMTLPLPGSLASLLAVFGPLFTTPSFRTFCGLVCGFLAQTGKRTVCGMLAGAGLSRAWPHDRAHRFFARARWSADDLGLAAAKLVVALLVPAGEPVVVAIDDTLARRRGKKCGRRRGFMMGPRRDRRKPDTATTG
jgi:DDE superfamily endonuclease